jgi:hypothetical protein
MSPEPNQIQGFRAAGGFGDAVMPALHQNADDHPVDRVVVDNKDIARIAHL